MEKLNAAGYGLIRTDKQVFVVQLQKSGFMKQYSMNEAARKLFSGRAAKSIITEEYF